VADGLTLAQLTAFCDALLRPDTFDDKAYNGLQIEGGPNIRTVCTAVDASLETIARAAAEGADALIVHHGLLWGEVLPVTARYGALVRTALKADLSLLAYHLPLDAHPLVGNNAQIARVLHLSEVRPFGLYHGQRIGLIGRLPAPAHAEHCAALLEGAVDTPARLLLHGATQVSTVAVVSGRAGEDPFITEAKQAGVDLFITGEVLHESYHLMREYGLTVIAGGHYATETLGVKALGEHLGRALGVPAKFLDAPSGF
jgi:dinuclear metal center YbgI/SA1388 family protein